MPPKPSPKISEPAAGYAEALERTEADACEHPSVAVSFKEFAELDEEAAEMEVAPPSAKVKATAKRILTALAEKFPRYYMVFPDDDGEIAIQTNGRTEKGGSVLIVCEEEGALFSLVMGGESYQTRYAKESLEDLPDESIYAAIRKLG